MANTKEENVEVAARSQDLAKTSSTTHEKVFVLLRRDWDEADQDKVHEDNTIGVRQYMVNNGLRPTGDVEFVGTEDVPGESPDLPDRKRSIGLRYRVKAIPAGSPDAPQVHIHPEDGPEGE